MREFVYKGKNVEGRIVGLGDMVVHIRTCAGKWICVASRGMIEVLFCGSCYVHSLCASLQTGTPTFMFCNLFRSIVFIRTPI
jgi:hypothetical protein